ncbi:MAG TPA: cytoplasmic protein, partial [Verrucomicrobiae bacterium]|nr:cytoplasmic protein [Verrucomicrobiae bacterium]
VALLTHVPLQEKIAFLDAYRGENDRHRIIGRDVFLLFQHSIRNSKLANNLYKLGVSATVRNWKTINRLTALAKAMD